MALAVTPINAQEQSIGKKAGKKLKDRTNKFRLLQDRRNPILFSYKDFSKTLTR
jgi:hypothetical protein